VRRVVVEGGTCIGCLLLCLQISSIDHLLLRHQRPSVAKTPYCSRLRQLVLNSTIDPYGDRYRAPQESKFNQECKL
jgi:hypothetical protein